VVEIALGLAPVGEALTTGTGEGNVTGTEDIGEYRVAGCEVRIAGADVEVAGKYHWPFGDLPANDLRQLLHLSADRRPRIGEVDRDEAEWPGGGVDAGEEGTTLIDWPAGGKLIHLPVFDWESAEDGVPPIVAFQASARRKVVVVPNRCEGRVHAE